MVESHPETLPDQELAFAAWGHFAYLITDRNAGPAIDVAELRATLGGDADRMIRAGRVCGVLAESREDDVHLVRFEHHRFQEYFAARHIHASRLPIDWRDKFDAPRWQETMLNLVLLEEGREVVGEFAWELESLNSQLMQARQSNAHDARLLDEQEATLADRVELAGRLMRQSGRVGSPLRDLLLGPVVGAVHHLAKAGNPITQVKMMRTCPNIPSVDFSEILRGPLHSSVNWVRHQALLLMAGNQAAARMVGSDLATELGYDLANGVFPKRLAAYLSAVRRAPRHTWTLLAGVTCYVAHVIALIAVATVLFLAVPSVAHLSTTARATTTDVAQPEDAVLAPKPLAPEEEEGHTEDFWYYDAADWELSEFLRVYWEQVKAWNPRPAQEVPAPDLSPLLALRALTYRLAFGFVIALALVTSLSLRPALLWAAILGTGLAAAGVLGAIALLSGGERLDSILVFGIGLLAVVFIFGPLIVIIGSAIGAVLQGGGLLGFLALTKRARVPGHSLRTFLQMTWTAHRFGAGLNSTLLRFCVVWYGWPFALIASIWIAAAVLQIVTDVLFLPFHPVINGVLVGFIGLAVVTALRCSWSKNLDPLRDVLTRSAALLLLVGLFGLLLILLTFSRRVSESFWFLMGVVTLWAGSTLMSVAPKLRTIWKAWRSTLASIAATMGLFRLWRLPETPEEWRRRVSDGGPQEQADILLRTDHRTLFLPPSSFLSLLVEVRPAISEEPAVSAYWERRDQIEQILRQERQG